MKTGAERVVMRLAIAGMMGSLVASAATTVPLELPRPDGQPGSSDKPVKVYILAGQSNMLGFGKLAGAAPHFKSIFLTADPSAILGPLSVGRERHNLAAHGVYQSAAADAPAGAKAAIFAGAYDAAADYASMKPAKAASVALGTVSAELPGIDGPHTTVVTAAIDVPATGTYTLHAGFQSSAYSVVSLDGKEVYRKDVGSAMPVVVPVDLEQGKRYPITVTYMQGGSAAFWMQQTGLEGKGDLTTLTSKEKKFPYLVDDEGNWTVRNDVIYREVRVSEGGSGGPLSATSNGKNIGPEVAFGYVMGTYHDEQVLLIESSMGNRGLWWDFRPPSSGNSGSEGADKWEGLEYRLMVKGVHETLEKIADVVPGYAGQGYEIAGFVWWQGHKDGMAGQPQAEYEKHLVNLIKDLRAEFKAPDMKAAIATVGFGGFKMSDGPREIWNAQMAVGDAKRHPEFADQVATVDTRGFWRPSTESPSGADYHYNLNAETYMLTGDALGRAMVKLVGGQVEERPPLMSAPAPVVDTKAEPSETELATHKVVVEPIIVDGMMAAFVQSGANKASIAAVMKGERPKRANQFLPDIIDSVTTYYQSVGIRDYDWKVVKTGLKDGEWDYYSFDPAEQRDKATGSRYRAVSLPTGMENWFATDFDAKKAGWKAGAAPFAQKVGELVALGSCVDNACCCGVTPQTLWEKEVILIRKTVDAPALKKGHRYRLVVGGSNHVNGGDGFGLYVDGKLVAESSQGVGKRQGGKARGAHVYSDVLPAFEDGKVTIAVKSFLRYNHPRIKAYPPTGHLSVWLEEQKLPAVGE